MFMSVDFRRGGNNSPSPTPASRDSSPSLGLQSFRSPMHSRQLASHLTKSVALPMLANQSGRNTNRNS